MEKLGSDTGCPELGLPALGSFLFSKAAIPALEGCQLVNTDLLDAVRPLAFITDRAGRRPVDYKNLKSEELGSVYEALLELHPVLHTTAGTFELQTAGGNERKTTGSYYTPESLVQCLLDSALNPLLDEAMIQPDPEAAILNLKICDPACGSGHFLLGAAHRMAKRLAAIRTGDEEPSPAATHKALRDVIGRCIYGVDVNPMAVELCKVALWMEALEPGKPLSFLDHHIQCGNSLLGAIPALLKKGIPDEAFNPIEGDDKPTCIKYKKQNKKEREKGQLTLLDENLQPWERLGDLTTGMMNLDVVADDSIAGVRRKQEQYESLVKSSPYLFIRFWADTWCAAFVWKKQTSDELPYPITEEVFRQIEANPYNAPNWLRREVERLADQYHFFHWYLAFPDVFHVASVGEEPENELAGWCGGFDVVLGNPPWDTLSPDAKEFFSVYDSEVRSQNQEGQSQIIAKLLQDLGIAERWNTHCRELYAQVHLLKNSGCYRLFAPGNLGKGDFNVYRMFVEAALQKVREGGRLAQIVPDGLYNGANAMAIRKAFFDECELKQILGFENAGGRWFEGIHRSQKFCIYAARKGDHTASFSVAFNIRNPEQLTAARSGNALIMPVTLVREFSPDALAIMELGSQLEVDIAAKMYERWPKFGDESAGPPHRLYMREIDMGNDRELFSEDPSGLPLYEGRMVDQFDHRAKGYRSGHGRAAVWEELPFSTHSKSIQSRWYIPETRIPPKVSERAFMYRIGFCAVGSPTNERTLIAALLPRISLCGHSIITITFESGYEWAYLIWLAVANSFAMDFLVRQKVALNLTFTLLDSLPFPRLAADDPRVGKLLLLALRLTCTSPDMVGYWNRIAELGLVEPVSEGFLPPGFLNEDKRLEARAQLEAVVARDLFELSYEELEYILGTFPIVERRETAKYGSYKSRELILRHYADTQVSS